MRKKFILVSWTGGLDSTYLVKKLLDEGHYVETVHTNILNNTSQMKREQNAIDKLIHKFREYSNYRGHSEVELTVALGNVRLSQVPVIIQTLVASYTTHDEVAIGYVMNDDAVSFINDIKKLWLSYKLLCEPTEYPKLTFPIIKIPKNIIYLSLSDEYLNHVTWCERTEDTNKKCNICSSCLRMKNIIRKKYNISKESKEIEECS